MTQNEMQNELTCSRKRVNYFSLQRGFLRLLACSGNCYFWAWQQITRSWNWFVGKVWHFKRLRFNKTNIKKLRMIDL